MKTQSRETSTQPTESFFEDPLLIQTILVPIDFSEEADRALEFALPLAQHFGAVVHTVHVFNEPRPLSSLASSPALLAESEISGRLAERLPDQLKLRSPKETCHVRSGKPHQEIIALAQAIKADLIVLATHGQGGLKQLMLGHTAEKIIRHAPCPVLVVRAASRGPFRTSAEGIVLEKILVPVDFSACAQEGARYASVFATRVGADLRLMHAVQLPDYVNAGGMVIEPQWPPLVETLCLEAEDKLDEIVNFLPLAGISAETEVVVGAPIEKIVEASARPEVDLLITATHGYTGLRHALLGSIAEAVVRRARCPVLVVPSHRREPGRRTNS